MQGNIELGAARLITEHRHRTGCRVAFPHAEHLAEGALARQKPLPEGRLFKAITLEQARELAGELGITAKAELRKLQDLINDRGAFYYALQCSKAASIPKHVRSELDQLSKLLDDAIAGVEQLGDGARSQLVRALEDLPQPSPGFISGDGGDSLLLLAQPVPRKGLMYMRRLRDAAELAHDSARIGGGRPRLGELRHLCAELAAFYECFSGKPFTYDALYSKKRVK